MKTFITSSRHITTLFTMDTLEYTHVQNIYTIQVLIEEIFKELPRDSCLRLRGYVNRKLGSKIRQLHSMSKSFQETQIVLKDPCGYLTVENGNKFIEFYNKQTDNCVPLNKPLPPPKIYICRSRSPSPESEPEPEQAPKPKFEEDIECIMCYTNSRQVVFRHGDNAHYVCCQNCAYSVQLTNMCPVCGQEIDEIIKIYSTG